MKTETIVRTSATLAVLSFCLSAFAQAQSGHTFTTTVTTEKNGKKQEKPLVFQSRVVGINGRVDILQGDDEYKTGDYVITNDGGQTFWIISAKKKEAQHLTPDIIRKMIRKESFTVKDISLSPPAPSGGGGTVGGITTKDYRMSRRYTINARQFIFSETVQASEIWDFNIATGNADVPSFHPVVSFLALNSSAVLFKNDAFAAGEYQKTAPKGFPLRVVANATSTVKKKQEHEVVVVTCDAPVAGPIEAVLFTIPGSVRRRE